MCYLGYVLPLLHVILVAYYLGYVLPWVCVILVTCYLGYVLSWLRVILVKVLHGFDETGCVAFCLQREKDSIKVDEEEGGATLNGTASSDNTGDSTEEPAPISSDSKQEPTPDTGDSTQEPTPLVVKETNDSAVEQDQTDQSPDTEVAA